MKKFSIPVVSANTFKEIVINYLVKDSEQYSVAQIWELVIDYGVDKFDIENLSVFLKSLQGKLYLPTMGVDFGDSSYIWVVSGTNAILVKKPI